MKKNFVVLLGCLCLWAGLVRSQGQTETNSLAMVIVYDASGSMKEKVPGADGKRTPKYLIANKAVVAIADKVKDYCDTRKAKVEAGLVVFANNDARVTLPLQSFDAEKFKGWATQFKTPGGGTPLGEGIRQARTMLAHSTCPKKHILVVTDGENNVGASPEVVIRQMQDDNALVSVYFVAFDVEAHVFDPVKKLGATVVSASNEVQLRTQLDAIVGKKILLEAE